MRTNRIPYAYGAIGFCFLAMMLFVPTSGPMSANFDFALTMIVLTSGIILTVRGVMHRSVSFISIGVGLFLTVSHDPHQRWVTWLGLALFVAGFVLLTRSEGSRPAQT